MPLPSHSKAPILFVGARHVFDATQLSQSGFHVTEKPNADSALMHLRAHPSTQAMLIEFTTATLEFVRTLKAESAFADIPIVVLSARESGDEIAAAIKAGVYYWLAAPYEPPVLQSILSAALEDYAMKRSLHQKALKHEKISGLLQESRFRFTTREDAASVALFVASYFPDPGRAIYGIHELTLNAIEHGNLGIGFAEKSQLMREGRWDEELQRRLALSENAEKYAILTLEKTKTSMTLTITDQGVGFDWKPFLEIDPARASAPNGRGIATARMMSFTDLTYLGSGNEVRCRLSLEPHTQTREQAA